MRGYPRIPMVVLFNLVSLVLVHAIEAQPQRRGIPAPKETRLPEPGVAVTMHRFNRLPVIELSINEQGPYRLIVDTGASGVVLKPKLVRQLELPAPPGIPANMQIQVRTPGGSVPATLHYIDKLHVDTAEFLGVWTIATAMPFGDGMDGVIGMNVFKECVLTYDYPANRIQLAPGELPAANGQDIFSYQPRMPDSHPVIKLNLDGNPTEFMIDTGMLGWFGMAQQDLGKVNIIGGPAAAGMGLSVGKAVPMQVARIESLLEIGRYPIRNPIVRLTEENIIGTLFLENFVVSLDGKNHRIRLARDNDEPLVQPAERHVGFGLKREGQRMVVWFVHPDSHAASVGLNVDDTVIELDGRPAIDVYDTREWVDQVQDSDKILVHFQSTKKATSKTVEIEVLEILK